MNYKQREVSMKNLVFGFIWLGYTFLAAYMGKDIEVMAVGIICSQIWFSKT